MSYQNTNPMGRQYSAEEISAAVRLGLAYREKQVTDWHTMAVEHIVVGPVYFATGGYHPDRARAMAEDWLLVADAMEREWADKPE